MRRSRGLAGLALALGVGSWPVSVAAEAGPVAGLAGEASGWAAVVAAREALGRQVDAGERGAARESAAALVAAARTALAVAPEANVDATERARAERHVEQVDRIAREVAEAEPGSAAAKLRLLDSVLVMLRRQLPEGQHDVPREVDGAAQVEVAPARTLVVVGDEYSYTPSKLVLRAGEPTRIEFRNGGGIRHELVVADPNTGETLVYIHTPPHATREGTFRIDEPGEYPIVCPIEQHAAMGMLGTLRVEP